MIRECVVRIFRELLDEAGVPGSVELTDELVLLSSGLDSLGFAVLVTRLEEELGFDPFASMKEAVYPQTLGEFVVIYEKGSGIV